MASRSPTQTLLIRWLVATARHSSKQLAADTRGLLTITPTSPPPAPLLVPCPPSSCQAIPRSHGDSASPPSLCSSSTSFLKKQKTKTHNPFCLLVTTCSHTFTRCPFTTSTHKHTYSGAAMKKRGEWSVSKVTDVTAIRFSNGPRPWELTDCNTRLFSTGTGSSGTSGCQGKSRSRAGEEEIYLDLSGQICIKREQGRLSGNMSSWNIIHTVCSKTYLIDVQVKRVSNSCHIEFPHISQFSRCSKDALVLPLSL